MATACAARGRLSDCKDGDSGCRTGRSPRALCSALVRSGLTVLSLQSPQAGGLGDQGRLRSAEHLRAEGVATVGLDRKAVRQRIGSLAVRIFTLGGHDGVYAAPPVDADLAELQAALNEAGDEPIPQFQFLKLLNRQNES